MHKHITDRWVAALRSGEYEQTTERLCDSSGYCCLGVLCVLAKADGVELPLAFRDHERDQTLDETIMRWSDMLTLTGAPAGDNFLIGGVAYLSLASANDQGATFNEIADVIEKRWKDL